MTESACQSRFERLMDIADRYARHLSSDREKRLPGGVLLLERDGRLHTVMVEGSHRELAATARELVSRHRVTSAALILSVPAAVSDEAGDSIYVLGESADGAVAERRYRVQPGFRRRRLTPMAPDESMAVRRIVAQTFRPLFSAGAVHLWPTSRRAVRATA